MPYFKVIVSGRGILFGDDFQAIGFFTTRTMRARDAQAAGALAQEQVLAEWREGGRYAGGNRGAVPALTVERHHRVGFLAGLFARPAGYTFYESED